MKIIQLSDFHINETTDIAACFENINKLYNFIIPKLIKDELIVCCICGDIIDKGNQDNYSHAIKVFDFIADKFQTHNFHFEFVPGNHDISGKEFIKYDLFIEKYIEGSVYQFQNENVNVRPYGDIDLILINSSFHRDHNYGSIDLIKLKDKIESSKKPSILVTHHTLLSRYDGDSSAIRNAYEFTELLRGNDVIALLHGHTHGYSEFTVGTCCKIIGIGPFGKEIKDVNNQFNIIEVTTTNLDNVENCFYRADLNKILSLNAYSRRRPISYSGSDLFKLYTQLVKDVKTYGCINNFHLKLITTIDTFVEDIETNFSDTIKIAGKWLNSDNPQSLHYNHAQYINKGKIKGLDYIVEELNRKATSSRAILPLINVKDVIDSGDNFLPSLDIIQFGFDKEEKDELFVAIYLRALEVNHFLKINLCEIYLMTNYISAKIRSVSKLTLNITSFRAQYKEDFGCFEKAELDSIDETKLMVFIFKKDIKKILYYLNQKLALSETVIIDMGIKNLWKCINTYNQMESDNFYNNELINELDFLIEKFGELKDLRKQTSVYQEIKRKEDELKKQMLKSIRIFEKLR